MVMFGVLTEIASWQFLLVISRTRLRWKAALNINYFFQNMIKPKLETKYEIFRNATYKLGHCVGIPRSRISIKLVVATVNRTCSCEVIPSLDIRLIGIY